MRFDQLPGRVKRELVQTVKELIGSGYKPEYYEQVAGDFAWVFEAGTKDTEGEGKELDLKTLVSEWTGKLIVSIGEGQFRNTVSTCVTAVMHDAYERGRMAAAPKRRPTRGKK